MRPGGINEQSKSVFLRDNLKSVERKPEWGNISQR